MLFKQKIKDYYNFLTIGIPKDSLDERRWELFIPYLEIKLGLNSRKDYSKKRLIKLEKQFFIKFVAKRIYDGDSHIGYIFLEKESIKNKVSIKKITQKVMNDIKNEFDGVINEYLIKQNEGVNEGVNIKTTI